MNGIKVLFSDGRNEAAYIFIAGQDTEETVVDLTCRLKEDGWYPISSTPVVNEGRGWVRRESQPSLRQLLGMRPVWKVG